jgi:hypothetical protein
LEENKPSFVKEAGAKLTVKPRVKAPNNPELTSMVRRLLLYLYVLDIPFSVPVPFCSFHRFLIQEVFAALQALFFIPFSRYLFLFEVLSSRSRCCPSARVFETLFRWKT